MTVAPPFFLISLFIVPATLALLGVGAGLAVRYIGLVVFSSQIRRPIRSTVLAVLVSFLLVMVASVYGFLASLVPNLSRYHIPYPAILYVASCGVFFFRLDSTIIGKKEILTIALLALIPPTFFEVGDRALNLLLSRS